MQQSILPHLVYLHKLAWSKVSEVVPKVTAG